MSHKVLFVDDDQSLLRSFERNLSFDYNMATATSGKEAIALARSQGPFSVVVVDMRMPEMDGIRTIKELREIEPSAVYIMLTGNQDVATAAHAVNDGEVFRFLNKPCEMAEIKKAINAGQKQHDLIVSEKVLLQETLVGSINVLTDLIEMQNIRFLDTGLMSEILQEVAKPMNLEIGWEESVAARVCLVGMILLPHEEQLKLYELDAREDEHQEIVAQVFKKSAKMIERIPRLGRVAKLLAVIPTGDGWISASQHANLRSATLIRAVFYWNLLSFRGLKRHRVLQEIKLIMPNMTDGLYNALDALGDQHNEQLAITVPLDELKPGMVICQEINNDKNQLVLSKGRRLTEAMIENLKRIRDSLPPKLKIVAGSCPVVARASGF